MAEEVISESPREQPYPRPKRGVPSPLQTGLLYGAGGLAVGGPVGLLAGLFAGVLSKRAEDSYLDRVARDMHNTRREYSGLQEEIKSELQIADPDEARLLQSAQRLAADGWYRLQSGDETGRDMVNQANETIRGIMNADIQSRKAEQAAQFNTQRGLITNSATSFRDQYSTTLSQARQLDAISERVLELTADPDFDSNKPFNRSILADLVSIGVGGMFKDNPNGFLAGLAEGGAGTIVGAIAQGTKTWLDADEFKVSKEDYNRIALNARKVARQFASQRLGEIEQQAGGLDDFARKVGVIPSDYSLRDYVSGNVRDLQVNPAASIPSIRPTDSKTLPTATTRAPSWQTQRSTGPTTRRRPQITAEDPSMLSDDWFRQQIGVPTQRRRRPTN